MTNSQNTPISNNDDAKEYTFSEILYIIKKHIKLIVSINIIVILSTLYYTLLLKPQYYAAAVIMVSEDQNSMSLLDMSLGSNRNYIDNEIQILQSRTTSELVVNRLLNSEYKNDLYIFNTKKYESPQVRSFITFGLIDKMNNVNKLDEEVSDDLYKEFVSRVRKSITVSNIRNTDAVAITIVNNDPDEAMLLVNTLVDVYTQRDLEFVTGEMSHLKVFLIDQLSEKEIELTKAENKLKIFQKNEKIFSLDEDYKLLLTNLTSFESEYNKILAQLNILNEKENYLNKQLNNDEKNLTRKVSNTINQRLKALKNEIILMETELISTKTKYGDAHQAVKELRSKLDKLKVEIENETNQLITEGLNVENPILYRQALIDSVISLRAIKSSLNTKALEYKNIVDEYSKKLQILPDKILSFTRLERERSIHAETFAFMQKKLEEARIGEASKLGKIRVVDNAIKNNSPIKPNKIINMLIGLFFGLFASMLAVFGVEFFDNTIKSLEQIERRGLSILALIPAIKSDNKNSFLSKSYAKINQKVSKLQRRLIMHEDPKSPISESYRGLRTSLMYTKNDSTCNTILISSSGPGEGKTTTIANLAITYANLGKKTLLVDSDLRKPVLHNVFKLEKKNGLTSYLSGNSNIQDIIQKTEINNLDLVTSGIIPPNPSELLSSDKMGDFLNTLKEKYDFILFDTPPLIAVTDAYVILKHVNQFVLVVRAGITERGALERVITTVDQSKFSFDGVVMNAMSEEHAYGSGYYYNYYQYYYGQTE